MGTQLSLSQRGTAPNFRPISVVAKWQMAAWIKMPLGMAVGLSPDDFVLDGDPAPFSQKGAEPTSPIFGPFLLWTNGWMHQDATWYGGQSPISATAEHLFLGSWVPIEHKVAWAEAYTSVPSGILMHPAVWPQ